jgi:hypothetical protein
MRAERIDRLDETWEQRGPVYRVTFWSPAAEGFAPNSDDWRIVDVPAIDAVIEWAEAQRGDRSYEVFVEFVQRRESSDGWSDAPGVIRLTGWNPVDDRDPLRLAFTRGRPAGIAPRTALGRGRLTFSSGVECDVSLVELTDEHLIVRARVVAGAAVRDVLRETPRAVDERGGEYTWFHTVSGGGPIGNVIDWVFRRPGTEPPRSIRVYAADDPSRAVVAELEASPPR